jgi:hypothetical protein
MKGNHGEQSRLIFDIETAGVPFDTLDAEQQEYLLKFAETEEEREAEKLKVSLYPFTADLACIGMLNVDSCKGEVLINASSDLKGWKSADGRLQFVPCGEREMLEHFWEAVMRFDQLISFNGRSFDGPFLHIRSAMLGVPATRNLVPYRYSPDQHCDLLDQFTFYGASRKFNLDFVCKAMGIDSPKTHGITGLDVPRLFREGKHREIAEYNARDLYATRELYLRWAAYMNVSGPR